MDTIKLMLDVNVVLNGFFNIGPADSVAQVAKGSDWGIHDVELVRGLAGRAFYAQVVTSEYTLETTAIKLLSPNSEDEMAFSADEAAQAAAVYRGVVRATGGTVVSDEGMFDALRTVKSTLPKGLIDRDPGEEHEDHTVLAACIAGGANVLVTRDKGLLEAAEFIAVHLGVMVTTPTKVLYRLRVGRMAA